MLARLLLISSSTALLPLAPSAVRPYCRLQRGRSAIRCAAGPADDSGLAAVLQACAEDPAALAKRLSKDALRAECARRSLRISGTKAELAPRLVEALRREQRAPLASGGAPPASARAPRPNANGTGRAKPAVGLADRISQHLAEAAAPAVAQPKRRVSSARKTRRRSSRTTRRTRRTRSWTRWRTRRWPRSSARSSARSRASVRRRSKSSTRLLVSKLRLSMRAHSYHRSVHA